MLRTPVAGSWSWREYGTDWVALDAPRHTFVPSVEGLRAAAAEAGLDVFATVWDSTELQFWRSEQYRRDIPLLDPASHQVDPRGSSFSRRRDPRLAEAGGRAQRRPATATRSRPSSRRRADGDD